MVGGRLPGWTLFEVALRLNKKQGIFTSVQMRQAVLAALDIGAIRFRLDPIPHSRLRCDSAFGGWNCDPDFAQLVHAMETERQFEKRYRLRQDLQRLFWECVPYIHYGHASRFVAMRKHVHGRPFDMPNPYFWNVWVEK